MLRLLLHFRCESVSFDRTAQLFDRHLLRLVSYEQQIEIFFRLDLSFPLVFHQLDTVKLCQSLFDLVRSVASQDLHGSVHAGHVERDVRRLE